MKFKTAAEGMAFFETDHNLLQTILEYMGRKQEQPVCP